MGALTNNRKRGDDYFKTSVLISPTIENSCGRSLKKQKISATTEQCTPDRGQSACSSSVVSRIALYPELKTGFRREVHAPVRSSRFWNFSSPRNSEVARSKESSSNEMGTFSRAFRVYDKLKGMAMRTLRFYDVKEDVPVENQNAKELIEIDNEEKPNDLSADSSMEELENKDFTESRWKARQGNAENSQEPNVETLEKEVRSLDSSLVTDGSNVNTKVDDMEKMAVAQLDQVPDVSGLPPYKRMLEEANKRTENLSGLQYMIEIIEKRLQMFSLLRPRKKEEEIKKDVVAECFVPLNEDEKNEISRALSRVNRRKMLVKHENSNIDITGEILQCLRPGAWLNDEVINLYLELLKEREKREPQKFLKCHFFNTFFYKKLNGRGGYNFQSVKRWTTQKKLGYALIDCDKIFVPIHKEVHWCLAIINKKDKKFQYLDSLKGDDAQVLNVLSRYFVDEVKDKCAKDIDVSSWDKEFVEDLPEQQNGFDCGMFMIKYADFYSRDIGLRFSQEHMPYFRQRTAKEILRLRAD